MKPAIGLVVLIVLLVAGDMYFAQGQGLHAFESWFSHLVHKRVVE